MSEASDDLVAIVLHVIWKMLHICDLVQSADEARLGILFDRLLVLPRSPRSSPDDSGRLRRVAGHVLSAPDAPDGLELPSDTACCLGIVGVREKRKGATVVVFIEPGTNARITRLRRCGRNLLPVRDSPGPYTSGEVDVPTDR